MDKATAIKQRAQAHIQRNSLKDAMAEYEKLLVLEPVDPYAYILLGDLAVRMKTREVALKRYGQAVDAYEAQGLCRNAIAVLKKIQRIDATQIEALRRLADLYAREGLMAESMSHYLEFGSKCLEAGRDEETRQVLEIVSQLGTANLRVAKRIADLCVAVGDKQRAATELERIAAEFEGRGQIDRARELRVRAAELGPVITAATEISLEPAGESPEETLAIPDEPIRIPELVESETERSQADEERGEAISASGDVLPGLERSGGLFQPVSTPPATFLDQPFSMPQEQEMVEPEPPEPEAVEPEVVEPEAMEPEVVEPEAVEPEADPVEPEVVEAEEAEAGAAASAEPEPTEPEMIEPEPTEPEMIEPEPTEPEMAEPEPTEPEMIEPEPTEPEMVEAESEDPLDVQIRTWASEVATHLEAGDRSAAEAVLEDASTQCAAAGHATAARRFLLELWELGKREIPVARKLRDVARASGDTLAEARWIAEIGEIQLANAEWDAARVTFEAALELDPNESLARRRYERLHEMTGAPQIEASFETGLVQGEPVIAAEPIAEAELEPAGESDGDDESVVPGEPVVEMELVASADDAEVVEIDRVESGVDEDSTVSEMPIEAADDLPEVLRGGAALDGITGLTGARGNGHGDEKKKPEPPLNPATDDQLAWVIGRFQRDVSSQLGAGDHASHYDLGMAYMEMELYHEAISEFRQALGGASYRRRCLELLATCYSRAGEPQQAASHWRAALDEALKTGEGPLALHYELAVSLAAAGQVDTAREELREVVRRDPTFLDASERLQALGA